MVGKSFRVQVAMSTVVSQEEAANYRIRAYPYKGDDIFNNYDCKQQSDLYSTPKAFEDSLSTGPPTGIKDGEMGSILLWEDVLVIVDELSTKAAVGDLFAICFCDGNIMGCSAADHFQVLVQAWELSGALHSKDDRVGSADRILVKSQG